MRNPVAAEQAAKSERGVLQSSRYGFSVFMGNDAWSIEHGHRV
jgi:hypothetical protein